MTLEEKLNRLPPFIARLLAKSNGRLMTTAELMEKTGFGHEKLERISKQKSWARIAVADVDTFLQACGLNWSSQRRQRWLLELAISKGRLHKIVDHILLDMNTKPRLMSGHGNAMLVTGSIYEACKVYELFSAT